MGRQFNTKDDYAYRVKITEVSKDGLHTSIFYYGPYSMIGSAKGQATETLRHHNRWGNQHTDLTCEIERANNWEVIT